jgi:MoaA/NifB/PqqE/SkfB family radical SAM enzyme
MKNNIPWRITIDTNPDQCNLNCIMCDTHSIYNRKNQIKRQRMSPTILQKILRQSIKLGVKEIIPSTMGEPLLYPYFDYFIEHLIGTNTQLNLTTNGTFPKKGAEVWARELLPITSDTKISINGISKSFNESIMIHSDTEMVLKNIKTYLKVRDEVRVKKPKHKPTITLQVTFMLKNLAGIKEVIKFAVENNVDRVKGHHLWVTYPELAKENLRSTQHREVWNRFIKQIESYRDQIKLENFGKLSQQPETIPDDYICPFLGNELWIDCYGNYNVCCAPSKKRKGLGDFGKLNNFMINEVFATNDYQNLLKNYKNNSLCQNCLLRKPK